MSPEGAQAAYGPMSCLRPFGAYEFFFLCFPGAEAPGFMPTPPSGLAFETPSEPLLRAGPRRLRLLLRLRLRLHPRLIQHRPPGLVLGLLDHPPHVGQQLPGVVDDAVLDRIADAADPHRLVL